MKTLSKRNTNYYCRNRENPCGRCDYYVEDKNPFYGWCNHPQRRIPPSDVFPNGTMPSTGIEFSCEKFKEDKTQEEG